LLSAAIVEMLDSVWVCCGGRTPPKTQHSTHRPVPTLPR
jgi:hypothetical protein